jgi:hypothetical protein
VDRVLCALKLDRGPRSGKRLLLALYGEEDAAALGLWSPHMAAEAIGAGRHLKHRGGRVDVHAASLFVIKHAFLGALPSVAVCPPRGPGEAAAGLFPCVAGGFAAGAAGGLTGGGGGGGGDGGGESEGVSGSTRGDLGDDYRPKPKVKGRAAKARAGARAGGGGGGGGTIESSSEDDSESESEGSGCSSDLTSDDEDELGGEGLGGPSQSEPSPSDLRAQRQPRKPRRANKPPRAPPQGKAPGPKKGESLSSDDEEHGGDALAGRGGAKKSKGRKHPDSDFRNKGKHRQRLTDKTCLRNRCFIISSSSSSLYLLRNGIFTAPM